jgi:hypothetical protein
MGTVVRKRSMNYSMASDNSLSSHLEIEYQDASGNKKLFVSDNSLLVYFYSSGSNINVAEKNGKVLVATWLNLSTAPAAFLIMGAACLYFTSK